MLTKASSDLKGIDTLSGREGYSVQIVCQYNVTGWNIMSKCLGRDISVRQHSKSVH